MWTALIPRGAFIWIAGAAVLAAVAGFAYMKGSHSASLKCEQARTQAVAEALEKAKAVAQADALATARNATRVERIRHEVRHLPPVNDCTDFMRNYQRRRAAILRHSGGVPDAVPPPD